MTDLIYKEDSYRLNGTFFEIELEMQGIEFVAQHPLKIEYKERPLKKQSISDFICFGKIIVKIKAVKELTDEHRAQLQNYPKATGYKLGLLVDFGHYPKIQIERVAN